MPFSRPEESRVLLNPVEKMAGNKAIWVTVEGFGFGLCDTVPRSGQVQALAIGFKVRDVPSSESSISPCLLEII